MDINDEFPDPKQEEKPKPKQEQADKIKIRCPYCGHRIAIRQLAISSPKEAVYLCEFCNKPMR